MLSDLGCSNSKQLTSLSLLLEREGEREKPGLQAMAANLENILDKVEMRRIEEAG